MASKKTTTLTDRVIDEVVATYRGLFFDHKKRLEQLTRYNQHILDKTLPSDLAFKFGAKQIPKSFGAAAGSELLAVEQRIMDKAKSDILDARIAAYQLNVEQLEADLHIFHTEAYVRDNCIDRIPMLQEDKASCDLLIHNIAIQISAFRASQRERPSTATSQAPPHPPLPVNRETHRDMDVNMDVPTTAGTIVHPGSDSRRDQSSPYRSSRSPLRKGPASSIRSHRDAPVQTGARLPVNRERALPFNREMAPGQTGVVLPVQTGVARPVSDMASVSSQLLRMTESLEKLTTKVSKLENQRRLPTATAASARSSQHRGTPDRRRESPSPTRRKKDRSHSADPARGNRNKSARK